jgi:hypothetical protein
VSKAAAERDLNELLALRVRRHGAATYWMATCAR